MLRSYLGGLKSPPKKAVGVLSPVPWLTSRRTFVKQKVFSIWHCALTKAYQLGIPQPPTPDEISPSVAWASRRAAFAV